MTTRILAASCVSFVLATAAAASAATLHVANNGLDGSACGPKTAPCRSITRAITNAAAGDTIVVGPGRYGDLDRDGTIGEANEEGPNTGALILIDKAVSVVSTSGAVWTVIDVAGFNRTAVRITASGARFGKAKKGFTVFDSSGNGVAIEETASGVVVEGNLAVATATGFASNFGSANALFQGNVASANATGFGVFNNGDAVARGNLAVANTNGFELSGTGTKRCEGNVALGNDIFGFSAGLYDTAVLTGNVANGNGQGVFGGSGDALTIGGLAALANVQGGVHAQGTTAVSVSASNLVGNGAKPLGWSSNCGTLNEASPLTATNVFWGAATGPGDDPADDACDLAAGVTTVAPFAAKPFKVKPKVPQP